MTSSVYIADIDVRLIPAKTKSRLHPIHKSLVRFPVVMDENYAVDHDLFVRSVNRMFKDKDMSRYRLVYRVSNYKFSTKCQWSK
jgi:hypothetical protein